MKLSRISRGQPRSKAATGRAFFDPVLCEIVYRWFCPKGGQIPDPFAGGSDRGSVASYLGYEYTGIDLRLEQVEANRRQADKMFLNRVLKSVPTWIQGDLTEIERLAGHVRADLLVSCPPYADLEVYSDNPADIKYGLQ